MRVRDLLVRLPNGRCDSSHFPSLFENIVFARNDLDLLTKQNMLIKLKAISYYLSCVCEDVFFI